MKNNLDMWTEMYESLLNEGAFNTKNICVDDIINMLKKENGNRNVVKIVLNGKFYNIKDVYSIDDDDTSTYVCIEGETDK